MRCIMKKKKDKIITDTVLDNDDYFYRDNEMARCNIDNPKHQVDPFNDLRKDIKKGKNNALK